MVYLLTSSSGTWDEYREFIIAITTCPFKAENIKQEYLAKLKKKKNKYSKKQIEMFDKEIEDVIDGFYSKEQEEFLEWYTLLYIDDYSDTVSIKEIQENIIICN